MYIEGIDSSQNNLELGKRNNKKEKGQEIRKGKKSVAYIFEQLRGSQDWNVDGDLMEI